MRDTHWRYLLWCLLLLPLWSRAEVPAPPAAFWDYLEDFGDQDGEVFDPLDLTEAEKIVRPKGKAATKLDTTKNETTMNAAHTQPQEESQP